ncbi:MAG: hypothetical protein A2315_02965 [Ignavibacteria bacterium RIFOXYB2_FULL_35_12]|nr:MAG: hypothetical protein A2058_11765 [Ignavibacteria bacterium GWA2_36_19]OGU52718.1 MAG: hypothetical protein A2006_13565 [Ignavibacteria bacterium GWC2_35_8]OGU61107.1 MAG: hypothetical protein A2X60_17030 [Ignavibacteria bacterium GWF2_35_20]OGU82456.1 MAG: hypothetical protein A2254_17360 [Ignavibacteria bacterium RIFOXYA2_FULL_35_9]OGU84888.1 MAG: hypothetical protein A3K31_16850 [Ignavibacteria bacterium RIFOXYA12_FULL_35_25]OGU92747.1 MAG: hypothetical protein A2492_11700 [Ignavibac
MLSKELLKQVRQIEIRTKGLVNQVFSGEYHSVFKGRGMEFSEVREYNFGDDIRNIDWNVTARFGHPYIKIFEEERELTVILLIDLSGSLSFGSVDKTKQQIAAELSAILAFSALKNNDKVGLFLFSDKIEKFIPPRKGRKHVLRIIRELLSFKPEGRTTNIKAALEHMNHAIKKKSIVFLISDFMDEGYEKILRIVGKKHDLIGIVINDQREKSIPKMGLVKFTDAETGMERWIDSSSSKVQSWIKQYYARLISERKTLFIKSRLDSIEIKTGENYVTPLVNFFRLRERRW